LVISGLKVWNDITDKAPDNALVIEIKAKQFGWEVRYPGEDDQLGDYDYRLIDATNQFGVDFTDNSAMDDVIPRKIYLPKDRPVLFKIRAVDVLHSVFAPHFRLKMDAVPGMRNEFWFIPQISTDEMRTKTGNPEFNYELACTEVCGRGHFAMRMEIVVYEENEFNEWYAAEEPWAKRNQDYVDDVRAKRSPKTAEKVKELEKATL
jgi:cytochrome c oxidase subunit 2